MCMSCNDYDVQNVHKYSRKTYKKNRRGSAESYPDNVRDDNNTVYSDTPPKNERFAISTPGCSCDIDPEGEVANILHIKCPVIALAHQQLQNLLYKADLLCDNHTRCCRSVVELLQIWKDALWENKKSTCVLVVIIFYIFMMGLLMGAATCGVSYRRFNSPIFTCIDNFFIPDTYTKIEDSYRSIV